MRDLIEILNQNGPSRSSFITEILQKKSNLSSDNARKIISRATGQIKKFPIPLLPNREHFVYLLEQRHTELFWDKFLDALRITNSVYGFALDSLMAKGCIILKSEFNVISGAPIAMKRQVSSDLVYQRLHAAGVIGLQIIDGEEYIVTTHTAFGTPDYKGIKSRKIVEEIILDGLKDWLRKTGLGSYNKIEIRTDPDSKRVVGPFKWDLSAPSYIFPFKDKSKQPGWVVADVFGEAVMDEYAIKYIARKSSLASAVLKNNRILPILVAAGYSGTALTKGRSEGILLTTPETLFGKNVARGLQNLVDTLKNAAGIAAANPERIILLLEQLKDIEGSAGNLRGILFELMAAHLAKVQGGSIEFGISAKDNSTGKTADIDVLRILNKGECIAIECKGKNPGTLVNKEEIEDWIKRLPTFHAHIRQNMNLAEAKIIYEIWTTSDFHPDAIQLLTLEKSKRTKNLISWKNGFDVIEISKKSKEKAISKALNEHFIKHPLA